MPGDRPGHHRHGLRPGPRQLREAHHRQGAPQRPHPHRLRTARSPRLLLLHPGRRRLRGRSAGRRAASPTCSSTSPSRAPTRSAPPTTRPKRSRSPRSKIAYAAYDAEYRKRVGQDPAKLAQLKKAFDDARDDAQKVRRPQPVRRSSPKQNGAVGLNASTGEDSTQYFWSMPSNRLELWAYMESGRIGHPVAPRVLQGARRRAGRAPHAHRLQPHRRAWSSSSSPPPTSPIPTAAPASAGRARSARSPPPRPTPSTRSITFPPTS